MVFAIKTLLVITGFLICTTCSAQTIVGKWKGVSVKNYYSVEYSKQTGRSMEEKFAKDVGNSEINYLADHSFIMTFSAAGSTDMTVMKGTWDVAGDQLKLTLEPRFNPRRTTTMATFSVNGNTMVTTAVIAPPSRIIKTVTTGTRL
jgi:hypothetical protein